jgi:hypothetical protein
MYKSQNISLGISGTAEILETRIGVTKAKGENTHHAKMYLFGGWQNVIPQHGTYRSRRRRLEEKKRYFYYRRNARTLAEKNIPRGFSEHKTKHNPPTQGQREKIRIFYVPPIDSTIYQPVWNGRDRIPRTGSPEKS